MIRLQRATREFVGAGGEGTVLYLDYGGGYMTTCIC